MEEQHPALAVTRPELEFDSLYANNTHFELSVWDLKIFFGQLEQHTGKPSVGWHTAVTVPWMQAKILEYYLRTNIAIHEIENEAIKINPNVMPLRPSPPLDPTDLQANARYEASLKIFTDMFG